MTNPSDLHYPGDISGNLRIRTTDPWEKIPLKKYLKFYFGLKYPKMATTEGDHEIASVRVLKSMSLFTFQKCPSVPRIALLFSKSVLLFPGIAPFFFFQKCSFVFQKCFFISQKFPIVFENFPLVFQKCLLSICCARLFRFAQS